MCGSNVAETSNPTTRVALIPQHRLVYLSDVFNKHSHECIDKSSICVMWWIQVLLDPFVELRGIWICLQLFPQLRLDPQKRKQKCESAVLQDLRKSILGSIHFRQHVQQINLQCYEHFMYVYTAWWNMSHLSHLFPNLTPQHLSQLHVCQANPRARLRYEEVLISP